MNVRCRENLEIQVYHHPYYQSLNGKLMDELSRLSFISHDKNIYHTNIKGSQLNFSNRPKPKGIVLIENWAKQIIQDNCKIHSIDFNFTTWVAKLDKGQQTLEHDHLYLSSYSFVYFVNTPKGSSPLVFPTSRKRIKAESGKLVLFPPSLRHKVPINKCDNRITVASNITMVEQ